MMHVARFVKYTIAITQLVSAAEQAGLSLIWPLTPNTGVLRRCPQYMMQVNVI